MKNPSKNDTFEVVILKVPAKMTTLKLPVKMTIPKLPVKMIILKMPAKYLFKSSQQNDKSKGERKKVI